MLNWTNCRSNKWPNQTRIKILLECVCYWFHYCQTPKSPEAWGGSPKKSQTVFMSATCHWNYSNFLQDLFLFTNNNNNNTFVVGGEFWRDCMDINNSQWKLVPGRCWQNKRGLHCGFYESRSTHNDFNCGDREGVIT